MDYAIPFGDEQDPSKEERYYTLTAYSEDHEREAEIRLEAGVVMFSQYGLEFGTKEWRILMHAVDLVQRDGYADKEQAIALLEELFGDSNVFVKKEA